MMSGCTLNELANMVVSKNCMRDFFIMCCIVPISLDSIQCGKVLGLFDIECMGLCVCVSVCHILMHKLSNIFIKSLLAL